MGAEVYTINPLSDPRWAEFAATDPRASAFHQPGWLEALSNTYGYAPLVLTSSPPGGPLQDGLVICRVSSWITGTRLVSLPFSDHCQPLLDTVSVVDFVAWLQSECDRQGFRYIEFRPLSTLARNDKLEPAKSYWLHTLDLSGTTERIFGDLHKDCFQRRIRRAHREKLVCDMGRSEQHLNDFFRLLVMTRRRQYLPPQPRSWFKNLLLSLGAKAQIRIARKNGVAIAAMLSLEHRSTVVYKYGCSDQRFHQLGAMPFLFWNLIEGAKVSGAETLDLGRSDLEDHGLVVFKDRLGAAKQKLTYYRYPVKEPELKRSARSPLRLFFAVAPDAALTAMGRLLYRHVG